MESSQCTYQYNENVFCQISIAFPQGEYNSHPRPSIQASCINYCKNSKQRIIHQSKKHLITCSKSLLARQCFNPRISVSARAASRAFSVLTSERSFRMNCRAALCFSVLYSVPPLNSCTLTNCTTPSFCITSESQLAIGESRRNFWAHRIHHADYHACCIT